MHKLVTRELDWEGANSRIRPIEKIMNLSRREFKATYGIHAKQSYFEFTEVRHFFIYARIKWLKVKQRNFLNVC